MKEFFPKWYFEEMFQAEKDGDDLVVTVYVCKEHQEDGEGSEYTITLYHFDDQIEWSWFDDNIDLPEEMATELVKEVIEICNRNYS